MMRKMKTGRLVAVTAAALCSANVLAMPTAAELKKTQPLVAELMAPSLDALKEAGAKEKAAARVKVGDASCAFAKEAETEAAKFMLLKGAVFYYANGGDYDKAGDALQTLKTEIKSVPPNVICEIVGKMGKVSESKAPKLYANYWLAKLQMRAAADAKKLAEPRSSVNQRRYAEDLAISKDWAAASPEFAKVNNAPLRKASDAGSDMKGFERGDFWWTYEPALENADNFFRLYAASLYKKQLAANEITGLKKNLVEKRLADLPAWMKYLLGSGIEAATISGSDVAVSSSGGFASGKAWQEKGNTAWLDLGERGKLEFVKCPAGSLKLVLNGCGETARVNISRPFWFLKNELKWNQAAFCPGIPCGNVDKPMRGNCKHDAIVCRCLTDEFGDSLPKGYVVRRPTLAELQYAFRADTRDKNDPYYDLTRIHANDDIDKARKAKPNAWGISRMGWVRVLDCPDLSMFAKTHQRKDGSVGQVDLVQPKDKKDPLFWSDSNDAYHMMYMIDWVRCEVHEGPRCEKDFGPETRLVVGPDLVSEWKAKHGNAAAVSSPTPSSGKTWQEKGNAAMLKLENGTKIDFVKCSPGKFKMLYDYENCQTCPVSITRPFWISKTGFTRGMYAGIYSERESLSSDRKPENCIASRMLSLSEANDMMSRLMEDFGSMIPKGYVFRFPSIAEFEYAYHANTKNRKNPYYHINSSDIPEKMRNEMSSLNRCKLGCAYGFSLPNEWGIQDMFNYQVFADRLTDKNSTNNGKIGWIKGGLLSIAKPKDADDPFLWTEDETYYVSSTWHGSFNSRSIQEVSQGVEFHLVVGPDLVSEWKAKHGKK